MNTLRECAEAAVKASGADGWQITAGTAHAWAVTLYFNRDEKDVMRDVRSADGPGGSRGHSVVAAEVAAGARGDTEVSPANSSESPNSSPAVRSWKRWGYINDEDGNAGTAFLEFCHRKHSCPVTILEGHDAVERIEQEAYERGWNDREDELLVAADRIADDHRYAIDGVSPVVVDGWNRGDGDTWGVNLLSVRRSNDRDGLTPCRVHIYPGIGKDGKLVKE